MRRKAAGLALVLLGAGAALTLPRSVGSSGSDAGWLMRLAGWGAMALPVVALWVGAGLMGVRFATNFSAPRRRTAGGCLLLLAYLGFLPLLPLGERDLLARAAGGQGGGYLGWLVSLPLEQNLGGLAAGALLLVAGVAGVGLLAQVGPRQAIEWLREQWERFQTWQRERRRTVVINSPYDPPEPASKPLLRRPKPAVKEATPTEQAEAAEAQPPATPGGQRPWVLPPIDVFEAAGASDVAPVDIKLRIRIIEETLQSFGVDAHVVEVNQGPAVTQFGVEPGTGVKVARILALGNDLALRLAAAPLRMEAPVPGKHVVGIEVPNGSVSVVSIRDLLESPTFRNKRGKLRLTLGRDVSGAPVVADLARMPHLLIAGSTGSGKSVCLNSFVASLLYVCTPDELRLLMIDPKMVEMMPFSGIPHLLTPVVTDMEKVVPSLKWVTREMERRYRLFAARGCRNIEGYNRAVTGRGSDLPLPYLVVIIDELADLMMVAPDEVEKIICRLAQLARATGIHLVVATQRPSVDVVTGLIKANFPTRISFAVTSQIDSRVILDQPGAEKLLGRGDMLYLPPDAAKPVRLQGTFVSDGEILALVEHWKTTRPPEYTGEVGDGVAFEPVEEDEEADDLYEEAVELVSQHSRVSASLLQRRLRIGYNRASRLMELLETEGIVGPSENGKSREVLINAEPVGGSDPSKFNEPV
jgi:DNA segregation ATPase FtsK/SpoIIIE, S-DNA-T family